MILEPDKNKVKIAYLWSSFPATIGIVFALIDSMDGSISYYSLILLFGFSISSICFYKAAISIYHCSLEVNNKFVLKNHNNVIKHLDWEKVNYVYVNPKSFFRPPYIVFISKEKEKTIIFRISVLSEEDQLDLMTMVNDLVHEKSIQTNFCMEITTIPN